MSLLGSKKGQVSNYFTVIIFLFMFGFLSILGYLLMSEMIAGYAATSVYNAQMEETGQGFLFSLQVIEHLSKIIEADAVLLINLA